MSVDERKVPLHKLSWKCETDFFEFQTTDELGELEGAIGQERAFRSIEFGLGMAECGFNLYLAGEPGTGKTSLTMNLLKK